MKDFLGDSGTTVKEIAVSDIGINAVNDQQGIARFKLHNETYGFDIDFTLLAILENSGDETFQCLIFEALKNTDSEPHLNDVTITPYSNKALAQLASLGCTPHGVGKALSLGSVNVSGCLDIMNQETFYNPTFQSGLDRWRDKVGFCFNGY